MTELTHAKVDFEPDDEPHRPQRKDQVYDINRRNKGHRPDGWLKAQPNGYIKEVEDSEIVIVAYYDEPEESEVIQNTHHMDWNSEFKRWYVQDQRGESLRNRLILHRARKRGINLGEDNGRHSVEKPR